MIIAKGEEPHTKQSNKQKGKLEYTTVYHTVTCHPTFQLVYIIQTCYDLSNNTLRLRLDSSGYI